MSSADRPGVAKEVPADRLANAFAGGGEDETGFALLPRRRQQTERPPVRQIDLRESAPAPSEPIVQAPAPAADPLPATPAPSPPAPAPEDAQPSKKAARGGKKTGQPRDRRPVEPDPGTHGVDERIRPSNVHIPVSLLEEIRQLKKARRGLGNGDIIIMALEETYDFLEQLINPTRTGGKIFAARTAKASRGDEPLSPLNYRLTEADFAVLDGLVTSLSASSRGHLITTALTAFFARSQKSSTP